MPHLPTSPNLEYLKQQAKTLLKALRALEPDALRRATAQFPGLASGRDVQPPHIQLADAQLLLAREYGFSSWPRLKAYVEALTVDVVGPATPLAPLTKGRSARQQFVHELGETLLTWSRQHDTPALGARFAELPLRDILAVRKCLTVEGNVGVVVDGLLEGLGHSKPRVRFNCTDALDHMADERCAEPLRERLGDSVPRVRRAALHALSCDACKLNPLTPGEDLVPILIDMALNDPSIRVRRAAVPMLESYCRDARAESTLHVLAGQHDAAVRRTAREVLRRRGISVEKS